jgi:hypothetical protein
MSSSLATTPATLHVTPLDPTFTTFHPFPRLPKEVQLEIWGIASRDNYPPNIWNHNDFRPLSAQPSVLQACKEARSEGLKTFKLLSFEYTSTKNGPLKYCPCYVDPVKDIFCYLGRYSLRSVPHGTVWLKCLIEAKVQQIVIRSTFITFFNQVAEEDLSGSWFRDLVCFETLLTGSIKTLIFVRHDGREVGREVGREDQSREVNLKILRDNWEPELMPEWEHPSKFEELKEKRKWVWNGNVLYGRLEDVV